MFPWKIGNKYLGHFQSGAAAWFHRYLLYPGSFCFASWKFYLLFTCDKWQIWILSSFLLKICVFVSCIISNINYWPSKSETYNIVHVVANSKWAWNLEKLYDDMSNQQRPRSDCALSVCGQQGSGSDCTNVQSDPDHCYPLTKSTHQYNILIEKARSDCEDMQANLGLQLFIHLWLLDPFLA